MQDIIDFDEYGGAVRDFTHDPATFIQRTRQNGTLDDAREEVELYDYPEDYSMQASMLRHGDLHKRRYGPVHVHHKGRRYVVSGAMVHALVPSFKTAAMGIDAKTGEVVEKYPVVSEEHDVHTSPMWPVSAGQGKEMRISAPIENAGNYDQNVKNSEMHVGAPIENEGSTFMSIHGVGALIKQSLQSARDASSAALGVFSYKTPVSNKDLNVATKMAPTLETIRDGCHKMHVGTEMLAPINKKLEVPVHTVIEEKPATFFDKKIKIGAEMKELESAPLTHAVAHIQNMKVSAPIKDEMTAALTGAYAAKCFIPGRPAMKVEAFYGKGMAYHQTGTVHLPNADANAEHTYSDNPVSTSYVGVKLDDDSVVCHVTNGVDNAGMTTIRTCMSPNSETPYTKVSNMHDKSSNAFRVSAPIKEGEKSSGKSLTFIHSN